MSSRASDELSFSIELLSCPHDGTGLRWLAPGELACASGAHSIAIREGILDFSPTSTSHEFDALGTRVYDWVLPWIILPRFFGARRSLLADLHAQAFALARGGVLIDAPCGTGVFSASELVRSSHLHYHGVDLSLPMLRVARRRYARDPGHVTLLRADLMTMPVRQGAAHVVLCSLGLQFMHHREATLREIRRVLQPGGWFLGVAPAFGLHARYDRRHQRRANKDFPLDAAAFPDELARAGFALDQPLHIQGALVTWKARAS